MNKPDNIDLFKYLLTSYPLSHISLNEIKQLNTQ